MNTKQQERKDFSNGEKNVFLSERFIALFNNNSDDARKFFIIFNFRDCDCEHTNEIWL